MENSKLWYRSKLSIASALTLLIPSFIIVVYILAPENEVFNRTSTVLQGIISSGHEYVTGTLPHNFNNNNNVKIEGPVQDLIDRLRERTKLVLADEADPYTEEEKQIWELQYPCSAREGLLPRYQRRKFAKDVDPNPAWQEVFEAYTALHRACIRRVGNLTHNFYYSNTSTVPGCQFVLGESYTGLGNKMLVVSSTLLFAILSERVFLVPTDTSIPAVFCEPFEGSSWEIDNAVITDIKKKGPWMEVMDTFDWIDQQVADNTSELHRARVHNIWQPLSRFYCDTEQAFLTQVPWIQIAGCLHFLPRLFTIPKFKPILESLFPDRMALTHLLRSAMLPSDVVWERILNVDEVYLEHTERQIGIQVRYFSQNIKDKINSRVADCCIENVLLPEVQPFSTSTANVTNSTTAVRTSRSGHPHSRITKVFIASLLPDVHDFLNQKYLRQKTVGGVGVGLVQLTHENYQQTGIEVDSEALVEIICLSFSDHILVTPQSTFGGIAQAYGALVPWFVNFERDATVPDTVNCQRGRTVGVCFQNPPRDYDCKHDASLKGHRLSEDFPYIQVCPTIDTWGIELITSHVDA